MAFADSSGNKFTNHSAMRSSEARLKAKGPSAVSNASADGHETEQDGAAIAQQHGPAQQIDIQHGETHTVHAMHPDGHSHETQHASAGEAHKFAADCAGVGAMA